MQTAFSTTHETRETKTQDQFVFVLQLHCGKYVVGTAANPCKRIAAINSGHNKAIPKSLQVNRIIGIKPMTEERNTVSVFKKFCDAYGENRVLAVWGSS